jgi:hypothetical protein
MERNNLVIRVMLISFGPTIDGVLRRTTYWLDAGFACVNGHWGSKALLAARCRSPNDFLGGAQMIVKRDVEMMDLAATLRAAIVDV